VTEHTAQHGQPRNRRRLLLAAGGILIGFATAGTAAATYRDSQTDIQKPTPRRTAKVQRTTLVEGQTFKGAVQYGEPTPLTGRLPGTVTRLPATGQLLRAGDPAYWLDNRPVVFMTGDTPAYRTLAPGIKGPDVRQLETNLKALGFGGFTVDDTFSSTTAQGVKRWQKRMGLEQTGVVEFGRVVFQPTSSVRVGAHKVRAGDQAGSAALYEMTGTLRRVVFALGHKDRALATLNNAATVLLPGGTSTAGVISEITEDDNKDEPGAEANLKVVVTVVDQQALGDEQHNSVDVRLVAGERKDVLAVPIVALLALDEGRYGVEVVTGSDARIVPVQIGLFAAGKVEIHGEGIIEGTDVSVPAS
jgi:hypothetical protein